MVDVSLADIGYNPNEKAILNRVRQHQQVLFDSDLFDASGVAIDPKYFNLRQPGENWSEWRFGKQCITPDQLTLWQEALEQLAPRGRRQQSLGEYTEAGHKIWHWSFEDSTGRLQYTVGASVTIFCPHGQRGGRRQQYVPGQLPQEPLKPTITGARWKCWTVEPL